DLRHAGRRVAEQDRQPRADAEVPLRRLLALAALARRHRQVGLFLFARALALLGLARAPFAQLAPLLLLGRFGRLLRLRERAARGEERRERRRERRRAGHACSTAPVMRGTTTITVHGASSTIRSTS